MQVGTSEWSRVRWLVALVLGAGGCAAGNTPAPTEPVSPAAELPAESVAPTPATGNESSPAPVASSGPVDPMLGDGEVVWETKDSGVALPAEWQSCSAADECELVVTTCCDQCNGGKVVSVAKSHAADARAKRPPSGCGACTKRGCSTRAACEAGRCVVQWPSVRP